MSPTLLSDLSTLIEARMGLFFPPERWRDLERRMRAIAPVFGCADAETCARLLVSAPLTKQHLELLAIHLTVGETYFFRESRSFEVLAEHLLRPLIEKRRGAEQYLRLWSAACCTGEEPYSLAMLLHQMLPDLSAWHTTILATNISSQFLQRAAEGVYGAWSFRNVPSSIQEQYFLRTANGRFAIKPFLKQMVQFSQFNLAADSYPTSSTVNAMDVILCRNVLIYFTAERARAVIVRLYHALADGGWLIVSPVETAYVFDSPFVPVQFPGGTFFRKDLQSHTPSASGLSVFSVPPSLFSSTITGRYDQTGSLPDGLTGVAFPQRSHESADQTIPREIRSVTEPQPSPYEEACDLYAQGRYVEVIEKLLPVCSADPGHSPSTRPASVQALTLLARAYANQGQLGEAQQWCEQALATNKLNPGLHYLRATILLERGEVAAAKVALTRSLYLDQDFVLAHFTLGNLARRQNELKDAQKYFSNVRLLLQHYQPDDILPESEGITAGRLAQIMATMDMR